MTLRHLPFFLLAASLRAQTPTTIDDAEVRLPYAELRRLLDAHPDAAKADTPPVPAALLSARYRLAIRASGPVLEADFRADHLGSGWTLLPLIRGDVSLDQAEPTGSRIIVQDDELCLALKEPGTHPLTARFFLGDSLSFATPPCSAPVLEITELPDNQALVVEFGQLSRTLSSPGMVPLPASGTSLTLRLIDAADAAAALRPPESSEWEWQHQAVVIPEDGQLHYTLFSHAAASSGSGLSATLSLPPDALQPHVEGDDLARSRHQRQPDGRRTLHVEWQTRDILDRDLVIHYRTPLRPLASTWELATPAAPEPDATRTRFIIAAHDTLAYSAESLDGPFAPGSLPRRLEETLGGHSWFLLEGPHQAALDVRQLPVAATAAAVVSTAHWTQRVEPDGASLTSGEMGIDHDAPMRLPLALPENTELLTCTVGGKTAQPVRRDDGTLEIPLPAPTGSQPTKVSVSFTSRLEALDAVEGVLALKLPVTPLFIHALSWRIDLPAAYRCEVQGSLTRQAPGTNLPPSSALLTKNLVRAEQPFANLFYLHHDAQP